jgi:hypothetical protein
MPNNKNLVTKYFLIAVTIDLNNEEHDAEDALWNLVDELESDGRCENGSTSEVDPDESNLKVLISQM